MIDDLTLSSLVFKDHSYNVVFIVTSFGTEVILVGFVILVRRRRFFSKNHHFVKKYHNEFGTDTSVL